MKKIIILSFLALGLFGCKSDSEKETSTAESSEEAVIRKADSLAHALIITDGHIDLPYRLKSKGIDSITKENGSNIINSGEGDFDYERAKEGGLNAPFMSIYIPARYQEKGGAKALADSLIRLVKSITTTYPEKFALAGNPQDIERNFVEGKISLPMGMENGAPIEGDLSNIEYFFKQGIRYVTLSHGKDNEITDSSYDTTATHGGLSSFGRDAVKEMNRIGMMVDVSHISDSAFYDVMEVTETPVIASHSSARHYTPGFERNMSDDLIQALAANGGVIQITFGSDFIDQETREDRERKEEELRGRLEEQGLSSEDSAAQPVIEKFSEENPYRYSNVQKVADHIDHVVELVGIEHVGLGSDFEGVGDTLPEGLKDVSDYPHLFAELLRRGYSNEDIEKISYKNVFRVWNEVLEFANLSGNNSASLPAKN